MAVVPAKVRFKWYQRTGWAAILVILCLMAAYGVASLALNSGSLLQYGVAIALLVLAANRAAHVFLMSIGKGRIG